MTERLYGKVEKGWGHEEIFVTNDLYCGKLLHFNAGAKFSMHFHVVKDETWRVMSGQFSVTTINTTNAQRQSFVLNPGDTWRNLPLQPHQLICHEAGVILEVSTADSIEDNYRVEPGDSQL